jgi:hypothetical protein
MLAAGAAAPGSAQADDEGADLVPPLQPAYFVLSITPQGAFVPAPTTTDDLIQEPLPPPSRLRSHRVVLACQPDAGTHPDPRQACGSLRKVDGYFERLEPPEPYACTREFAPARVEAIGYWGDRRVNYSEVFSNRCIAAGETDNVFRL